MFECGVALAIGAAVDPCPIRTLHAFSLDWFYQKSIIRADCISKKKALLGLQPSSAFFLLMQRHWKN